VTTPSGAQLASAVASNVRTSTIWPIGVIDGSRQRGLTEDHLERWIESRLVDLQILADP
jgi:hypothetical protein